MGFILQDVELVGSRKNKTVNALFDSGAFTNYIRSRLDDGETPDDIGFPTFVGTDLILADGSLAKGSRIVFREIHIQHLSLPQPSFVMMDARTYELIIGAELMQTLGITLDFPRERVIYPQVPNGLHNANRRRRLCLRKLPVMEYHHDV